jgi:Zn-dependent metalloprotease
MTGVMLAAFAAAPVLGAVPDSDPTTAPNGGASRIRAAVERLADATGGSLKTTANPATGVPRLVRIPAGALLLEGASPKAKATTFFGRYGVALGIEDPARELEETDERVDILGMTHLRYQQVYRGVPVFAAVLRAHFDPHDEIVTINGTFIPNLDVDPTPTLSDHEAAMIARGVVAKENDLDPSELETAPATLYVYRAGLARGVPGADYLVWEIEVSAGREVRELVYVDAHRGAVVDRIQGIHDLTRVISQYELDNVIWSEGDRLPFTGLDIQMRDDEVNRLIDFSGQTFDLFANLSGGAYLSYDGLDAEMHTIYERTDHMCPRPNASWDGTATNICFLMAGDDVVGHEWTHAYTMFTHQLIYAYQPGALNESYSDIFGELVDLLNDQGMDEPGPARTDGACSTFGGEINSPRITVHSPASLAGTYWAGGGPSPEPPWSLRGEVELVDDCVGNSSDACEPLVGFTPGRIALMESGSCLHVQKLAAAADAGAAAVIMVNDDDQGTGVVAVGWSDDDYLTAVAISKSNGEAFKAALANGLELTIGVDIPTDVSVRWLVGEDTVPIGAIRDMWNPPCFRDPNSVGTGINCSSTRDFGGVHSNSGVPNHAFALLVDGGVFNRHTVGAIGATRAAHIYWRAMSVYQVPTTDFADHADLLELSCADLVGAILTDLMTGEPSPETISPGDCEQVAEVMAAVNMRGAREWPIDTILAPDPPPVWAGRVVFSESFDRDPGRSWRTSNEGVSGEYDRRDWVWTDQLPEGGSGGAIFATASPGVGDCEPGSNDQAGVMHLDSPVIALPENAGPMVLFFDHYVATEPVRDGGNLKISVNGGPFQEIGMGAFLFNPYNTTIDPDWGGPNNPNPLAGENVFSGINECTVVGSWGESQIALDNLAQPGDTIQLRFDFGDDGCSGEYGWFYRQFGDGWYMKNLRIVETIDPTRRPSGRTRP